MGMGFFPARRRRRLRRALGRDAMGHPQEVVEIVAEQQPDGWGLFAQLQRNSAHELKIERSIATRWDILARCVCGEFGPYKVHLNTEQIQHAHWMHRTGQTGELYRWSLEQLGELWKERK